MCIYMLFVHLYCNWGACPSHGIVTAFPRFHVNITRLLYKHCTSRITKSHITTNHIVGRQLLLEPHDVKLWLVPRYYTSDIRRYNFFKRSQLRHVSLSVVVNILLWNAKFWINIWVFKNWLSRECALHGTTDVCIRLDHHNSCLHLTIPPLGVCFMISQSLVRERRYLPTFWHVLR